MDWRAKITKLVNKMTASNNPAHLACKLQIATQSIKRTHQRPTFRKPFSRYSVLFYSFVVHSCDGRIYHFALLNNTFIHFDTCYVWPFVVGYIACHWPGLFSVPVFFGVIIITYLPYLFAYIALEFIVKDGYFIWYRVASSNTKHLHKPKIKMPFVSRLM